MTYTRFASLILALALAVTLVGAALAEGSEEPTRAFIVNDDGTETELSVEELEALREESLAEIPEEIEVELIDLAEDADDALPEAVEAAPAVSPNDAPLGGGNAVRLSVPALTGSAGAHSNANIQHNVSITQKGSTVTVKGTVSAPHYFYGLFVDTTLVAPVTGSSVSETINMNAFATGYHTVMLGIVEGTGGTTLVDVIGRQYMQSNTISIQPTYNGVFDVHHNYFNYYPYDMAMHNQQGDLYMEYSADNGKTWTRTGRMRANMIKLYIQQGYEMDGLKAGTSYKTRIRYGEFITYSTDYAGDGKSYFFGGPVLKTTTIKTGAAKAPAIKSVTAKATSVKYHKVKHYGYYTGVYLYTEKFYTCKIKVTVKLKKKPGTKGLFINDTWVKGDKTSYTVTFSPYPNYYAKKPKGHYKYTVTVCSGQNKSWGGYSPSVSKTKTLS